MQNDKPKCDKSAQELSAELIALIYRYRWRIELFFKWLKCILGCRHWLAQSPRGVAVQVYCVLIAALLLLRATGRRPGKRAMEMIRFYLLGYATLEELTRELGLEKNGLSASGRLSRQPTPALITPAAVKNALLRA